MMKKISLAFLFGFLLIGCKTEKNEPIANKQNLMNIKDFNPPIAKKIPHEMTIHGDVRNDPYYWMKLSDDQKLAEQPDDQTQDVLDYLNAENEYTQKMLGHTEKFQEKIFSEIVGRIKQTDMSVPYKSNGYYYLTRYEEGKEYPIYSRKKTSLENEEEILLDVNELARPYDYYNVAGRAVSEDNNILAYGEDTLSRRIYTIKFKNLNSNELLHDVIENTTGGVVWANDNETVFYSRKDEALRSYQIYKHKLGTDSSTDELVFEESDETFNAFVYKSKSKRYIIIGSYATVSNEYWILDADQPDGELKVFQKRERNLEYGIAHYEDHWYIRTNKDGAKNFKLMKTPVEATDKSNWTNVIDHRSDVLFEGMDIFKDYLVLSERQNGITQLRVKPWNGSDYMIDFPEDAYLTYTSVNPEFETEELRLNYTSLTTPNTTYDFNLSTKKFKQLKQQEVVGDFDPSNYSSERMMVEVRDGTKVPLSIVYKKGFDKNGSKPLLLYAYGSYGNSMDPYFSSVRLSLLDRGFTFAIAHVRGGEEMGRAWYEDGKLLKKKNTFTDFIDCGKHLVSNNYCAEDLLFAMGGSAGGLLIGAVINMEPSLWNGAIAAVPFVDVVTTMLDESIPLTTGEFDEWGNPKNEEYYKYIKSYSPYDNVEAKEYPSLLITTGYHDSQVQYWEPAKWIAKLRDTKTDDNPLIMHCNMETGHGGASGRFQRFKETALEYAFLLDLAGISE